MRDGRLEASGHNWVEGQGAGPRIDKKDGEEDATFDAMGNKIDVTKTKKLTSAEQRKVRHFLSHLVRVLTLLLSFSSRRSAWHGKREARSSLMTSSKSADFTILLAFLFPFFTLCLCLCHARFLVPHVSVSISTFNSTSRCFLCQVAHEQ
jgi:hypothetical protein